MRRDVAPGDPPEDAIVMCGQVETLFFSGPLFSAGRLRTESGMRVAFAGRVFVRQGDPVVLRGRWGRHAKYGEQFEVLAAEFNHELDVAGLANYLAGHPALKGIGPVKAQAIAERCGREFDAIITHEPETLAKAVHVSLETIRLLREEWLRTKSVNAVSTWLAAFGLTHHQITTLVDKLGNGVRAVLEADPYMLVREVRGLGFKRVDKIAREMGTPKDHPGRLRAGAKFAIEEALDRGHTWTEYEHLVDQVNTLLVLDRLDGRELIERTIDRLLDEAVLVAMSPGDRLLVTLPAIRAMEEELARVFGQAGGPSPTFKAVDELPSLIDRHAPSLNLGQRHAVETALRHRVTLISGGAGSGKTFTIAAIAQVAESQGMRVVLCAPTGKAAKRLEEVVHRDAATIHRLLGYNGATYARDSENPIEADLLIIDEVSMVDVPLAFHLFRAVDLDRTAMVLVGDHNQLPPVGPGNILRDLIQTRAIPAVLLDKIVRQAGVLKANSIAILAGEIHRTADVEPGTGRAPWYVADQFTDQTAAGRFVLELVDHVLAEKLGFDLLGDVQVLTPTHKGPLGTVELNIALQRLIQKKLWGIDVPPPPPGRRAKLLPRDKVIQTRNNYELGVMNGAIGVVEEVGPAGVNVRFDGALQSTSINSDAMRDLDLAYALTVHKVQGSEFPCVVAVVHKAHAFMHHRNLLYTAVTRARKTVILVGDAWGMRNCVRQRLQDERRTLLPYLLQKSSVSLPVAPVSSS